MLYTEAARPVAAVEFVAETAGWIDTYTFPTDAPRRNEPPPIFHYGVSRSKRANEAVAMAVTADPTIIRRRGPTAW